MVDYYRHRVGNVDARRCMTVHEMWHKRIKTCGKPVLCNAQRESRTPPCRQETPEKPKTNVGHVVALLRKGLRAETIHKNYGFNMTTIDAAIMLWTQSEMATK